MKRAVAVAWVGFVLAACGAAWSEGAPAEGAAATVAAGPGSGAAAEASDAAADAPAQKEETQKDDEKADEKARDGGKEAKKAPAKLKAPERVFFIGHSLISDVPDMVGSLCAAAPVAKYSFKEQFIPGAPLRWQWEQEQRAKAPGYVSDFEPRFRGGYHVELAKGGWDALVLVEGVPIGARENEALTIDYLARFANFARQHNPGIRVVFYEPWPCIHSGTPKGCSYDEKSPTRELVWRERLEADGAMWKRIVDGASDKLEGGGARIELVPVARALGKLADAVQGGELEGFTKLEQFFEDEVHLSAYGKYYAALVVWSHLYQRSPVGRPVAVSDRWSNPYWDNAKFNRLVPAPKVAVAKRMQEIAAKALGY